jgi:hypothetical protein
VILEVPVRIRTSALRRSTSISIWRWVADGGEAGIGGRVVVRRQFDQAKLFLSLRTLSTGELPAL